MRMVLLAASVIWKTLTATGYGSRHPGSDARCQGRASRAFAQSKRLVARRVPSSPRKGGTHSAPGSRVRRSESGWGDVAAQRLSGRGALGGWPDRLHPTWMSLNRPALGAASGASQRSVRGRGHHALRLSPRSPVDRVALWTSSSQQSPVFVTDLFRRWTRRPLMRRRLPMSRTVSAWPRRRRSLPASCASSPPKLTRPPTVGRWAASPASLLPAGRHLPAQSTRPGERHHFCTRAGRRRNGPWLLFNGRGGGAG